MFWYSSYNIFISETINEMYMFNSWNVDTKLYNLLIDVNTNHIIELQ